MKYWVAALSALRQEGVTGEALILLYNTKVSQCLVSCLIEAMSQHEAEMLAKKTCLEKMPKKDGWQQHTIHVTGISVVVS